MKPEKPIKPDLSKCYATYAAYAPYGQTYLPGQSPCFVCSSHGGIIDPNAWHDPVEGYKMADRIICPECKGNKFIPVKVFKAKLWDPLMVKYRHDLAEYKRQNDIYQRAVKKLTAVEKRLLGIN